MRRGQFGDGGQAWYRTPIVKRLDDLERAGRGQRLQNLERVIGDLADGVDDSRTDDATPVHLGRLDLAEAALLLAGQAGRVGLQRQRCALTDILTELQEFLRRDLPRVEVPEARLADAQGELLDIVRPVPLVVDTEGVHHQLWVVLGEDLDALAVLQVGKDYIPTELRAPDRDVVSRSGLIGQRRPARKVHLLLHGDVRRAVGDAVAPLDVRPDGVDHLLIDLDGQTLGLLPGVAKSGVRHVPRPKTRLGDAVRHRPDRRVNAAGVRRGEVGQEATGTRQPHVRGTGREDAVTLGRGGYVGHRYFSATYQSTARVSGKDARPTSG